MANIHLNKQWPITTSLLVTSLMLLGMFALLPLNVHAQSSTSQVTVTSQDTNGNTITGYWTVLYDSSGSVAGSGYTPATFGTNSGHTYTLEADSYGSCTFEHWSTGSTADPMTITATSSDQTFTAVYNCGTGVGGGSSSSVTVKSVDQNNNPITGYYTILYDSSGNVLGNGYTSHTFATTSGQTYAVEADGYGSCLFDHWSSSGSTADPMSFTATSAAQTFTAVYN